MSKNGTTTAVYQTTHICGVDVREESARRKRFHVDSEASVGGPEAGSRQSRAKSGYGMLLFGDFDATLAPDAAAIYFPAEVQ